MPVNHASNAQSGSPLKDLARRTLILASASLTLVVISAWLNGSSLEIFLHPVAWLAALQTEASLEMLGSAAEVVAAVLAIATTVVAIVVELAATRFSHEITGLFLRERVNFIVLGLFVLTTVQCVWIGPALSGSGPDAILPQAGFAITLALVSLCLLLLIPYIYYVFTFLSPISVIERITQDAYRHVVSVNADNIAVRQQLVEGAIDELQDVARSAITQGDRGIAMASVDALSGLLTEYLKVRDELPMGWFEITEGVAADADFVALSAETMTEVRDKGIWLERKVFRRFMSLVGQSALQARDVANLVAIRTQQIASEFGRENPNLLEMALRAFNSYLRVTISARDARTAYFLMNQYRLLAEQMMRASRTDTVVQIAEHLKTYGQTGHSMGMDILLETASYDVKTMVEMAYFDCPEAVDPLLDCLLQLDIEIKEEQEQDSLLGVRRSQMQVATLLIANNDEARLQRVVDDLLGERMSRLERLRTIIMSEEQSQFAELADRGANFAYLEPERRQYLSVLFDRLRAAAPPAHEGDPSAI